MKSTELELLFFNPFHISKILQYALSGALSVNKEGLKTELIYIISPLIHNEKLCSKLTKLNKNSRLEAITHDSSLNSFIRILNDKILEFKKDTKHGIIIMSQEKEISIGTFIKINSEIHYKEESNSKLREIYKASYNLGLILAKERYTTIFRHLNILEL